MKYIVTVKIADYRVTLESYADIRCLWKTGITIMKCAKRHSYAARYIVRDTTGNTLFWLYCRKRGDSYRARLNRIGKYGRENFDI